MRFFSRRNAPITIGISSALIVMTALGAEEIVHALAGALGAMIAVSIFDLYERPNR